PIDFHVFGPLKKLLGSQHYRTNAEIQQFILMWLQNFDAGLSGLEFRWNKCLDKSGDYVEK
ncbi:hypothetical protein TNCV_1953171, partial [Trichonephila clavipes]